MVDLVWIGVVYLRDLDGTGSMHVCSKGDDGAIAYVPARDDEQVSGVDIWPTEQANALASKEGSDG